MKPFVLLASLLVSATAFANDVDPFNFEKEHFSSSMTRDAAIARSQAPAEVGLDIDNDGRVVTASSSMKTRAQVAAETLEASRLGLMAWGGHDARLGTADQEEKIRLAGEHASGHTATTE